MPTTVGGCARSTRPPRTIRQLRPSWTGLSSVRADCSSSSSRTRRTRRPTPREFALLLMAAHRAYLLDTFGGGHDSPERRAEATAALTALWERLLAE
jgi:hypothetical protein